MKLKREFYHSTYGPEGPRQVQAAIRFVNAQGKPCIELYICIWKWNLQIGVSKK